MRGDFHDEARRFEDLDRAALRPIWEDDQWICRRCRRPLIPVALLDDVWGCSRCHETWHLPTD
jgi:hypothetical protein